MSDNPADARASGVPQSRRRTPGIRAALRILDAILFEERSGWFAIDTANTRVRGVVVPSLDDGLRLVGQGQVTTIVGQLRPEVRAVDIDIDDEGVADALVELVVRWAHSRALWHLVRPSGGAPGRAHVLVAVGTRADELDDYVATLRADFDLRSSAVNARQTLRPLSAPHRRGGRTAPLGDLERAVLGLQAHAWADTPATSRKTRKRPARNPVEPLVARPRRRPYPLQPEWRRFLNTGVCPPLGGQDRSGSTRELVATTKLVVAGYSYEQAWAAIAAAHPAAFPRARASKAHWTRYVWNRVVQDDLDRAAAYTPPASPVAVASAAATENRLWAAAASLPPRQRRAFLMVGYAVLDRVVRTGTPRVGVAERDLVLDTGIRDRKTLRQVLRTLDALGVGRLDRSTLTPPAAGEPPRGFEFELHGPDQVREIPPPSFHAPTPPAPGTWAALPPAAAPLWRAAHRHPLADLPSLTAHALLGDPTPSPSTLRTARAALTALAAAGLASCDAEGRWTALDGTGWHADATLEHTALRQRMQDERAAHRAGHHSTWWAARRASIRAQRAREDAWWHGLDPHERRTRFLEGQRRFRTAPIAEQERVKAHLVRRRAAVGIDERTHHGAWLASMTEREYLDRSIQRAIEYAHLAPPLQHELVASWSRHRAAHDVPLGRTPASLAAAALADGTSDRDTRYYLTENPTGPALSTATGAA